MSGLEKLIRGRRTILVRSAVAAVSLVLIVLTLAVTLGGSTSQESRLPQDDRLSPLELLGGVSGDGSAHVGSRWDFRFPDDHGPHRQFQAEWWYVFGVASTPRDSALGIQLAFTRVGLSTEVKQKHSRWTASSAYYAFVTLSDPSGNVHADQRLSRAALGLAGAVTGPARIWLENWQLEEVNPEEPAPDWRLRAEAGTVEFDLELDNTKPLVTSSEIEDLASQGRPPFYFYTQPQLRLSGTLTIDGQKVPAGGTLSIEHAWGELPMPGGPVARDRFAVYLDDGRELLCIHAHPVNGTGEPTTTGILVERDGSVQPFSDSEIEMSPSSYWSSERSGARYPVSWTIDLRERDISLRLTPYVRNQEARLWGPVWAGVGRVFDRRAGGPTGYSFVQLAGYKGT